MGNLTSNEILDAMWVNFDERVKDICRFYRIQKKDIAEKIGINPSRMSQRIGNAQHTIAYGILLAYPNINARWLLFGQEPMIAPAPIVAGSPQDTPEGRAAKLADIHRTTEEPVHHSAEYDRLIDRFQAVVAENALLKDKLNKYII